MIDWPIYVSVSHLYIKVIYELLEGRDNVFFLGAF